MTGSEHLKCSTERYLLGQSKQNDTVKLSISQGRTTELPFRINKVLYCIVLGLFPLLEVSRRGNDGDAGWGVGGWGVEGCQFHCSLLGGRDVSFRRHRPPVPFSCLLSAKVHFGLRTWLMCQWCVTNAVETSAGCWVKGQCQALLLRCKIPFATVSESESAGGRVPP